MNLNQRYPFAKPKNGSVVFEGRQLNGYGLLNKRHFLTCDHLYSIAMKGETAIQVSERLGRTIHTREASNHLLQVVTAGNCRQVELDFANVAYISRSFADQFLAGKRKLAVEQQKSIVVTNANADVVNMLQAVAKTQNKNNPGTGAIPVYRFSSMSRLENFLCSI